VIFVKGLLHRMQPVIMGNSLDRGDARPFGGGGQHGAGFYGFAIHMDHTGTALAGIAADMRPRHAHRFPDEIDEKRIVRHVCADLLPVQAEAHGCHFIPPHFTARSLLSFQFCKRALE
jgi:hypothetical protein